MRRIRILRFFHRNQARNQVLQVLVFVVFHRLVVTHLVAVHIQVSFHFPVTNRLANARITAQTAFSHRNRQVIQSALVVFFNALFQVAIQHKQRIQRSMRHHGKFVATDPKAVSCRAISILNRFARSHNQGITRLVTEGVVCVLQAVHIHQHHSPSARSIGVLLANLPQDFVKSKPVFKSRQRIRCRDILQVFVHHTKLAVNLLQFERSFANERCHTGRKRKPRRHTFLNIFNLDMFLLYRRTFTHRGKYKRNVVLVQMSLFTQEFTMREKSGTRSQALERRNFVSRFTLRPESLSSRTRENMLNFRRKLYALFAFFLNALHNQLRFTIRQAHNRAFVNIRRHRQRSIRITSTRRTHNRNPVMFIKHREFKRVIEEVLVVLDIQVLVVDFVCRNTTQFIKNVALGTRHVEITANRFPAANLTGIHMQVRTTIKNNQQARFREPTHRRKHAGIRARNIGRADNTAKNLDIRS